MKLLSPIKPLTLLFCGIMISACNGGGGTQAATTATIDKNTTTKAAIELSQMGVLPVAADNNTSYPLIINNFSNDNYKIKSAYVINANGNQDQNIAEVKITDNHLDAHGNLKLNILPHSKTATSARLVVELANETDATITKTEEIISINPYLYSQKGLIYQDSGKEINTKNGHYDFSMPILLESDFTNLSATNGEVNCPNGMTKNSGCIIHFTGETQKTNLNFSLNGSDKNGSVQILIDDSRFDILPSSLLELYPMLVATNKIDLYPQSPDEVVIPLTNFGDADAYFTSLETENVRNLELNYQDCNKTLSYQAGNNSCSIKIKVLDKKIGGEALLRVSYHDSKDKALKPILIAVTYHDPRYNSYLDIKYPKFLDAIIGITSNYTIEITNNGDKDVTDVELSVSSALCNIGVNFDSMNRNCKLTLADIKAGDHVIQQLQFTPTQSLYINDAYLYLRAKLTIMNDSVPEPYPYQTEVIHSRQIKANAVFSK